MPTSLSEYSNEPVIQSAGTSGLKWGPVGSALNPVGGISRPFRLLPDPQRYE